MSEEQTLIPVEQKQIVFYDDELTAVIVEEARGRVVYVPIRPICEHLGISFGSQRNRINRDAVLSEEVKIVFITNTNPLGGNPNVLCLPLDYLNGWLFGISPTRVKPGLKEKVIAYQRECYKALAAAFLTPTLETAPTSEQTTLMQIREMGLAIAQMAEQQMALTTRLDKAAIVVGEHSRRLTALEQQLAPRQAITDEQAADIADKVKALAVALTEQDSSKNHFQSIFAELYRRFRVSSYKVIRQAQYHLVVDFLDEWAGAAARGEKMTG
jgi:hypothetical protein